MPCTETSVEVNGFGHLINTSVTKLLYAISQKSQAVASDPGYNSDKLANPDQLFHRDS